jgi:hypothetical protein
MTSHRDPCVWKRLFGAVRGVIPAEAGIHLLFLHLKQIKMDSRLRGNDVRKITARRPRKKFRLAGSEDQRSSF